MTCGTEAVSLVNLALGSTIIGNATCTGDVALLTDGAYPCPSDGAAGHWGSCSSTTTHEVQLALGVPKCIRQIRLWSRCGTAAAGHEIAGAVAEVLTDSGWETCGSAPAPDVGAGAVYTASCALTGTAVRITNEADGVFSLAEVDVFGQEEGAPFYIRALWGIGPADPPSRLATTFQGPAGGAGTGCPLLTKLLEWEKVKFMKEQISISHFCFKISGPTPNPQAQHSLQPQTWAGVCPFPRIITWDLLQELSNGGNPPPAAVKGFPLGQPSLRVWSWKHRRFWEDWAEGEIYTDLDGILLRPIQRRSIAPLGRKGFQ